MSRESKTFLILDVNYLAYRSFHTTGKLAFRDGPTGVLYGIFRDVLSLQDLHATDRVVFCFDHGKSLRAKLFPAYKLARHSKQLTPEQKAGYDDLRKQVNLLKTRYLPYVGFKNVFYQDGYEADDVIASVVNKLHRRDDAVIVSADQDLYQLLQPGVVVWNPNHKVCMTHAKFSEEFKISPTRWSEVKAIAGCSSDGVPGIKGVGEKTAIKHLNGEVLPRFHQTIEDFVASAEYARNVRLVHLPFKGCESFKIKDDAIDKRKWRALMGKLGMKSLRDRPPISVGFGFKKVTVKKVDHDG